MTPSYAPEKIMSALISVKGIFYEFSLKKLEGGFFVKIVKK